MAQVFVDLIAGRKQFYQLSNQQTLGPLSAEQAHTRAQY